MARPKIRANIPAIEAFFLDGILSGARPFDLVAQGRVKWGLSTTAGYVYLRRIRERIESDNEGKIDQITPLLMQRYNDQYKVLSDKLKEQLEPTYTNLNNNPQNPAEPLNTDPQPSKCVNISNVTKLIAELRKITDSIASLYGISKDSQMARNGRQGDTYININQLLPDQGVCQLWGNSPIIEAEAQTQAESVSETALDQRSEVLQEDSGGNS